MPGWLRTLLLGCVLTVALVATGWWYYQSLLDDFGQALVQRMRPVGILTHQGASANLDGVVSVANLRLKPYASSQEVVADRLSFTPASPLDLLSAKNWFDGEFPEQLRVALDGLQLTLEDLVPESADAVADSIKFKMSCRPGDVNSQGALKALGYDKLRADLQFDFRHSAATDRLSVNMLSSIHGMIKTEIGVALTGLSSISTQSIASLSEVSIRQFKVGTVDTGLNLRYMQLCHPDVPKGELPESLAALDENYAKLFKPGVRLEVTLVAPGVSLLDWVSDPEGQFENTDLTVAVNSELVAVNRDFWVQLATGAEPPASTQAPEQAAVVDLAESPTEQTQDNSDPELAAEPLVQSVPGIIPSAARKPVAKSYQLVEHSQLRNYLGSQVRLKTALGSKVQGELVEVRDNSIIINYRIDTGMAQIPVQLSQLTDVEVYR